jgi:hypothetical protein
LQNAYDDPDRMTMYTYDQINDANNPERTLADFEAEAAATGRKVQKKLYHEVSVILQNGENANLSIPDLGSGGALAGFFVNCVSQNLNPTQVTAKVKAGATVKNKAGKSFTPWAIEIASREPMIVEDEE